jgi:hypothetical protein
MGATVFLSIDIGENAIINNGVHIFSNVGKDEIIRNNNT